MSTQTLLLNASFEPIGVISWKRAMELVVGGKVIVLETYDSKVRSAYLVWDMPAVIALRRYIKIRPHVKFSRKNIYLRDRFTCQYCGVQAKNLTNGTADLTFDHVLPKSRGGKTCWDNIVAACWKCNHKKGDKTPSEAGLSLLKDPVTPSFLPMFALNIQGKPKTPDEWRDYLYWESDLDE